ncbi:MAG: ABC transporter [Caldilineae bacterium]|nr:MAG: ABC transporter [Caldilineae bacterium]
MNIFVRELKANFKSLIIWAVIVGLFVTVGVSKFSAYADNPEMLAILDTMPKALLDAFNLEAFNLTTLTGFFGVMQTYFALMLAIAAAMWGSDIISKEERDKTVEFSLTLPVTRSKLVTAKALAALVNCILLLLFTWAVSLIAAQPYSPDQEFLDFLSLQMQSLFLLQLIFLAIGLFLGCAMRQYRRAGSVAVGLLLATYFMSVASGMNEKLEFLKYLSPFKYFDAGLLAREARIEPVYLGLTAAIIVVCVAGAYLTYSRRDLYI